MKTQRSIYILVGLMSVALMVLIAVQYIWLGSAIKIKANEFDRNVLAAMRNTAVAMEEKNTMKFLSEKLRNDSTLQSEDADDESGLYRFIEETTDDKSEPVTGSTEEEKTVVTVNNTPQGKKIVLRKRTKNIEEKKQLQYIFPALPPVPPAPPVPPEKLKEGREKFISVMCKAADEYTVGTGDWKEVLDSALLKKTIQQQFGKFHLPEGFAFAVMRSGDDSLLLRNSELAKPKEFKYKTELLGFDFSAKGLWLMVDFPSRFKYVFASLAGMFALSLIFSGVIVVVFVLALRLIFRQKKLNEITNDFINNMTHEFKTPLATISMTADTLHLDRVSNQREQVKEYATMIKEEAGKLSRHVDRILEAASHEKGKTESYTQADLKQVIQKQLQLHENVFSQNQVKLQTHLPVESVNVMAEEENLGYVISNLLDNAIKYSKGEPEIIITVDVKATNVLLKVEDHGIGISKENRKMIFDKFFRAHTGNVHDAKGFGLGLSFVKSAVEGWGGKVWVESEQGKGSTFFVELKKSGK